MTRKIVLRALALLISVLPPALAALSYFPLWSSVGADTALSGFTAFLLLLAAVPIFRLIRRMLATPSAWMMWLIIFLLFLALSRVADEMVVVSFVGFVSNGLGAVLFKLAGRGAKNEQA